MSEEIASWVAFAVGNAATAASTAEELAGMRAAMVSRGGHRTGQRHPHGAAQDHRRPGLHAPH